VRRVGTAPRTALRALCCECVSLLQWYTIAIVTVMIYKEKNIKYTDLLLFCVYLCNAHIASPPRQNVAG